MTARYTSPGQDRDTFGCQGHGGRRRGQARVVNRMPTPSRGHGTQVYRYWPLPVAAASNFESNKTTFVAMGVAAFNYPCAAERNCYGNR